MSFFFCSLSDGANPCEVEFTGAEVGDSFDAEEIILARDGFRKGVNLYWLEKQYNFKFLAVEKVRWKS